jgi:hypothetical protein
MFEFEEIRHRTQQPPSQNLSSYLSLQIKVTFVLHRKDERTKQSL